MNLLAKMLNDDSGRRTKRYEAFLRETGALEPTMKALSDTELAALTPAFRERCVTCIVFSDTHARGPIL